MKYRVLLADDEPVIVKGLMGMDIWDACEIQPVPAMTGMQALNLLRQQDFDMVITDIRMPEMDGLELISRIREKNPEIPIIVLSGYDCFDYAREALRCHVADYLLKPVSQMELGEIVTRQIGKIQAKREEKIREEMIKNKAREQAGGLLSRQFEQYLLTGKAGAELSEILGESFILGECVPKAENRQEGRYYGSLLLDRLKAVMGKRAGAAVLFMERAVFAFPDQEGLSFVLEELKEWERQQEWTFFVSWIPADKEALVHPYERLSAISDYGFYCREFNVLSESSTKEEPGQADFTLLEEALRNEEPRTASARLEEALNELKRLNKKPEEARRCCLRAYLRLARYPDGEVQDQAIMELLMMKAELDFENLKTMLFGLLNCWETGCLEKRIESYSNPVRTAIRYVHEHLKDEELSLAMVAGKVLFLHPDYMGKLFKKETGISFTRYVTELRMEQARKLIARNPDIKVYELSEEVGFGSNPHYFGQTFRQAWGCTPTEYKKAQKEKGN